MKVVADTNVLISGLFWDGNEADILKLFKIGELTNLISPSLIMELDNVLSRRKFGLENREVDSLLAEILTISTIVDPSLRIQAVVSDPDDNRVLECALAGNAEFIISGDRHLLELGHYREITIIRASDFLKLMK